MKRGRSRKLRSGRAGAAAAASGQAGAARSGGQDDHAIYTLASEFDDQLMVCWGWEGGGREVWVRGGGERCWAHHLTLFFLLLPTDG